MGLLIVLTFSSSEFWFTCRRFAYSAYLWLCLVRSSQVKIFSAFWFFKERSRLGPKKSRTSEICGSAQKSTLRRTMFLSTSILNKKKTLSLPTTGFYSGQNVSKSLFFSLFLLMSFFTYELLFSHPAHKSS